MTAIAPFLGAALSGFAMFVYFRFGFRAWLACMAVYSIPAGLMLHFIFTH